jgi:hypothetical protein
LVDLFGKKKLEDRVKELESENRDLKNAKEDLVRTLEKREDKIRKLTSANQEANLVLKTAEQKAIAPSPVASSSENGLAEKKKPQLQETKLGIREMEQLVKRLKTCHSPEDDLLTAFFADNNDLQPELLTITQGIRLEKGGIILKYPQLFTMLLNPPFPILESYSNLGCDFHIDILQDMLETPVLVISAHAGDTFLGVALGKDGFEATEFVESQVKEKHSKGGWSQKRFERLREEDIKNHVDSILKKLAELRAKYGSVVQYAVLGGDQNLLKQIGPAVGLTVLARRLEKHDEKRLDRLMDEVYRFTCYRI